MLAHLELFRDFPPRFLNSYGLYINYRRIRQAPVWTFPSTLVMPAQELEIRKQNQPKFNKKASKTNLPNLSTTIVAEINYVSEDPNELTEC